MRLAVAVKFWSATLQTQSIRKNNREKKLDDSNRETKKKEHSRTVRKTEQDNGAR